jgi:hypothetical protein
MSTISLLLLCLYLELRQWFASFVVGLFAEG